MDFSKQFLYPDPKYQSELKEHKNFKISEMTRSRKFIRVPPDDTPTTHRRHTDDTQKTHGRHTNDTPTTHQQNTDDTPMAHQRHTDDTHHRNTNDTTRKH